MADLTNPVSATAAFAMKKTGDTLRNSGKQLATGQKGTDDIVSYVVGSKLRDSGTVLKSVALAGQYGSKLLSVAGSELISVKASLIELRNIIAQAAAPNTNTVANLDAMYKGRVASIINKLSNANFDSRLLFNGSLAGTGANNPAQGIPVGASPLDIRIGEAMTNNISVSIPRLLSGTGLAADAPIAGRFTPILPTSVASFGDKTAAVAQLMAIAGAVLGATANAAAADLIVQGIALPGNAIGDAVIAAAQAASAAAAAGAAANFLGANTIRNAALNAGLTAAAPYISTEALAAIQSIVGADAAVAGGLTNLTTDTQYFNAIQALAVPTDATGAAIINAAKGVANGATGNASTFTVQKQATLVVAVTQALINANPVNAAGNILSAASRTAADAVIVTAIDTVTANISAIGGQTQLLTQASDDLNTSILAIDESAHGYLDTNYEDAAKDFKTAVLALRGSISTTAQGYQVATAALSLIDS